MPLSLGNSVHGNVANSTTVSVTLTYSAGSILIADITANSTPITGVSSTALGAFTHRANSPSDGIERWVLKPGSNQTSDTITATQSASNFMTIDVYEVKGADTTNTFDSGGPVTSDGPDPKSITTVNANTMVIAAFRESSQSTPTNGTGFTQISGADFQLTEYQILSSAQTLSCTQGTGAGNSGGLILDAIVQASAGVVENYADFKGKAYQPPWSLNKRFNQLPNDFTTISGNMHWTPRTSQLPWAPMSLLRAPPQDSSSFGVETNPHWRGLTWPVQWLLPRLTLSAALDVPVPIQDTPPSYVSRMQLPPWFSRPILGSAFDVSPLIATPPSYVSRFQTPPWLLNWLLYRNTAQDLSSLGVETPYSYVSAHWTPQWNLNYPLLRGTPQDFSTTITPPTGVHIVTTMGAKFITPIGI